MRRVACLLLLAACYAPTPHPGSPCVDDSGCPTPLVCSLATMTCEHARGSIVDPDAPIDVPDDAPPIDADCSQAEVCGDGIDQDCNGSDVACAVNDGPAGAVDVTAGGTYVGDALLARDDVNAAGCGNAGGRDLFYSVTLTKPEVYYFDTFGSSFDSIVRVYTKPCAQVGAGTGAAACADDACNTDQTQVAVPLPAGTSCIVVDQADASDGGSLMLRVMKGGRDGLILQTGVRTTAGDTTNGTNVTDPIDMCDAPGSGGRDVAYFFTVCPSTSMTLDADICPEPPWDPVLYVRRVDNNTQLACNDDNCGFGPRLSNLPITNGRLFILYVDGFDSGEHGAFSLDSNIR